MVGFPNTILISANFLTLSHSLACARKSYNTFATTVQSFNIDKGLGSFAFAHRYLRNRCFFLFLRVLRCFNSPGIAAMINHSLMGSPIRKSTDQGLFTTPRRLSQQTTSFLASWCQWHPPYALSYLTILLHPPQSCGGFIIHHSLSLSTETLPVSIYFSKLYFFFFRLLLIFIVKWTLLLISNATKLFRSVTQSVKTNLFYSHFTSNYF